jgi:hypothetical protein
MLQRSFLMQGTAPGRPQFDFAAHRTIAPRQRFGTSEFRTAFATQLTYFPCFVKESHGHAASMLAWIAQRAASQS